MRKVFLIFFLNFRSIVLRFASVAVTVSLYVSISISMSLVAAQAFANIEEQNKSTYKVNDDGSYQYDVELKSRKNESSALRFGLISAPKISLDSKLGTTFSKMYGNGPFPIVLYDWEFHKFESISNLWVNAGFGFFSSSGKGRFAQQSSGSWFMPQLGLGGSYFLFAEYREDNKTNVAGSLGYYGHASFLFNVTKYDPETSFIMDREYNIRNLWLSIEYRTIFTFKTDLDASSGITSLGFLVEY